MDEPVTERSKRTWCYVQRPAAYCIPPCSCGNADLEWSEWEGHVWCGVCKLDFVPAYSGVFDGPIPVETARLMGMSFDQIDLQAMIVIPFEHYMEPPE